jgi:hypothetical protein
MADLAELRTLLSEARADLREAEGLRGAAASAILTHGQWVRERAPEVLDLIREGGRKVTLQSERIGLLLGDDHAGAVAHRQVVEFLTGALTTLLQADIASDEAAGNDWLALHDDEPMKAARVQFGEEASPGRLARSAELAALTGTTSAAADAHGEFGEGGGHADRQAVVALRSQSPHCRGIRAAPARRWTRHHSRVAAGRPGPATGEPLNGGWDCHHRRAGAASGGLIVVAAHRDQSAPRSRGQSRSPEGRYGSEDVKPHSPASSPEVWAPARPQVPGASCGRPRAPLPSLRARQVLQRTTLAEPSRPACRRAG